MTISWHVYIYNMFTMYSDYLMIINERLLVGIYILFCILWYIYIVIISILNVNNILNVYSDNCHDFCIYIYIVSVAFEWLLNDCVLIIKSWRFNQDTTIRLYDLTNSWDYWKGIFLKYVFPMMGKYPAW